MRTDPLRVALWCVVVLAALVFVEHMREQPAAQEPRTLVRAPLPDPPAPDTPEPIATKPAATHYVGNTNTHRFHLSTCRYAGCKNCTARFATREEAIQAGYRPGGCCDP